MAIYPQQGTDIYGPPSEPGMEPGMEQGMEPEMAPPEAPTVETPEEAPETPEFSAVLKAIQEALNTPDKAARYEVFKKYVAAGLKQVEGMQTLDMGSSRIRA